MVRRTSGKLLGPTRAYAVFPTRDTDDQGALSSYLGKDVTGKSPSIAGFLLHHQGGSGARDAPFVEEYARAYGSSSHAMSNQVLPKVQGALSAYLLKTKTARPSLDEPFFLASGYLAYSTIRFSRINVTLISPGYLSSSSILWAISFAILAACKSLIISAFTNTRISRPA